MTVSVWAGRLPAPVQRAVSHSQMAAVSGPCARQADARYWPRGSARGGGESQGRSGEAAQRRHQRRMGMRGAACARCEAPPSARPKPPGARTHQLLGSTARCRGRTACAPLATACFGRGAPPAAAQPPPRGRRAEPSRGLRGSQTPRSARPPRRRCCCRARRRPHPRTRPCWRGPAPGAWRPALERRRRLRGRARPPLPAPLPWPEWPGTRWAPGTLSPPFPRCRWRRRSRRWAGQQAAPPRS